MPPPAQPRQCGRSSRCRPGRPRSGRRRRAADPVQRRPDAVLFIPSRDHDSDRGPLPVRPRAGRRLGRRDAVAEGQQREGEESDYQPRDVGEQGRDHPRHDRADRFAKVRPPRCRHPDAERDIRDRQSNRDQETDRRTPPTQRPRPSCQTAEPLVLGREPLRHRGSIPGNPDQTRARTTLREVAPRPPRIVQRLRPQSDRLERGTRRLGRSANPKRTRAGRGSPRRHRRRRATVALRARVLDRTQPLRDAPRATRRGHPASRPTS